MALYGETNIYRNSLDPSKTPAAEWANAYLGATTSIEPGKAMKDLVNLPASGIENVEISVIDPSKFEAIPREMFAEARRLGKMLIRDFTKDGRPSPLSLHSPLVEPTGFAENRWDETHWKSAQQQLGEVVEKAAMLGPNVPINIHASQVPSEITVYNVNEAEKRIREIEQYMSTNDKAKFAQQIEHMHRTGEIPEVQWVVDPTSGEYVPLKASEHTYPWGEKRVLLPFEQLGMINNTQWDSMANKLKAYWKEIAEAQNYAAQSSGAAKDKWENYAQTYGAELQRETLAIFNRIAKTSPETAQNLQAEVKGLSPGAALKHLADKFMMLEKPPCDLFMSMDKFAMPKAAETFANTAMRSYDIATHPEKFMDKERVKELQEAGVTDISKAPIITIENVSPEMAFGRGESLKALVQASRQKFAERLMQEKHVPKAEADKVAERLIGATWDVGHINLMKRYGYDKEKIIAETEKIAKDVKHVHLTDNFGAFDAHLAPGMGNVPIPEIIAKLKEKGKIKDVRGIVEAGGYVMSYGENPTLKTLQYFNAPVYGFQGAPSWGGENPAVGNYFMGSSGYSAAYGMILPPIHYGDYGAGFSGLPAALGAVPGAASKSAFAGTPNA